MLSELMDRSRYGKISRFWFDEFGFASHPGQSPPGTFPDAWITIVEHVRRNSPGTMMLPGPDGCKDLGEGGNGVYPLINYVPLVPGVDRSCQNASAQYQDRVFAPFESDMSIENPGDAWFWHRGHPFYNASALWNHYLRAAGRGSAFILNVPPNSSGVIPEEYVDAARGVGDAIRASFGVNVGSSGPVSGRCDGSALVTVPATGAFDAVLMMEDLTDGQNMIGFQLELQDQSGKWEPAMLDADSCTGKTVGARCVAILAGGRKAAMGARFSCMQPVHETDKRVALKSISLHQLRPPGHWRDSRSAADG